MSKRWPIDILIVGSALTGLLTGLALLRQPQAFLAMLALINLSTSAFLALVVRPLVVGKAPARAEWVHTTLLVMFASSAGAFWIEYFSLTSRLGALSAAITWTLAGLLYAAQLVVKPAAQQKQPAEARVEADAQMALETTAPA